ncbi:MAG TPA: SelT/SelW/SelH family protein [Rhodospirillales bacterium]
MAAKKPKAKPRVEIEYCSRCRWLLRAGWMAQELLSTFEDDLAEVTIRPNAKGGVFEVRVGRRVVWSRKKQGRFPDIAELKQRVRDVVSPERHLGHVDSRKKKKR